MPNYARSMLNKTALLLCVFVCMSLIGSAQTLDKQQDTLNLWQLFKYDANKTFKGVSHAATRPLHWQGDDFYKLGSLVLSTAALSVIDEGSSKFFRRHENDIPIGLREFGLNFAQPHNYLMINGGLYAFGLFTKNEKVRKTSVLILSSSIFSGYLQILARTAVGRARPLAEDGAFTFKPFEGGDRYYSFPSGHTILGMTMAHSIAKQFDNIWVKIGIYTVGSIPALSRLVNGKHWITDVAFSTVLAIVVVDSIDKFLFETEAYNYPKKKKQVSWNLSFGAGKIGVTGTF